MGIFKTIIILTSYALCVDKNCLTVAKMIFKDTVFKQQTFNSVTV